MSVLHTDDRARNLEYPYHGPASMPFLVPVRLRVLFMGAALFAVVAMLGMLFIPDALFRPVVQSLPVTVPPGVPKGIFALSAAMGIAVVTSRKVGPLLTAAHPFKYWVRVLARESRAPRLEQVMTPTTRSISVPEGIWPDTKDHPSYTITPPVIATGDDTE